MTRAVGAQSAPVVRQIQIAHTALAGTYRALLQAPLPALISVATPSLEVPPTYHNQCGQVSLTATAAGRVTGQIVFASGRARAFTGRFDEGGQVFFQPGGRSALALLGPDGEAIDLRLALREDVAYSTLTGSLSHAETTYARISGGLAPFTAVKNPRAPLRTFPSELAGRYTAALSTAPASAENPNPAYPRGSGVATLTVSRAGLVILSGIMPDNTRIAYSGRVLGDLSIPLYVRIYQGRGSLSGFVQFRDEAGTDLDSANIYWSSPGNPRMPATWDGVTVSLAGSKYTGAGFIGAMPLNHVDYRLEFAFNVGPVTGLGGDLRITSGVTTYSYDRAFSVRVNRATGLLQGTHRSQDSSVLAPFRAAILSKQLTAYGYVQEGGRTGDVTIVPRMPEQ